MKSAKPNVSEDSRSETESVEETPKKRSNLGDIESQRILKTEMQRAALKFNFKPKNGIAHLVSANLIAPKEDHD